ncbi:hypothetical protein PSHI8_21320 [Polynucleobacter sp. SHI8]|uniref:hypothetical protein n=1 Tax=unclassified Polynucleobacter TaxID=2640945 RepID=UPI00249175F8|nr:MULTISPECIES: hypothetical protein [unclassified Polynucleobacter]BDW12048.1 hypothetical protein PSHI2_21300 [Polynucleobacter sp. SHI2]BDW14496.1 hypothetical protein PSHI8_21320 [Polynucleobacter sp. SHI8]
MKKLLLLLLTMYILISCSKKDEFVSFVCGENNNNSLTFSNSLNMDNPPKIMTINKDELIFCNKEGNVLKYIKETCEVGNTTIRFDPIIKEITFNEPPRQITMVCK